MIYNDFLLNEVYVQVELFHIGIFSMVLGPEKKIYI